jgi:hypothetical protein
MTKIFSFPLLGLLLTFQISFGQKMSKKEATSLLQKAITHLKNNDSTSFANMWYYDNTLRPFDNSLYTRKDAIEEFNELKIFLDTAITKNLAFDEVEIENFKSSSKFKVKYKIKVWFKYDDKLHYYKGYGPLVDFIDGKWVFRFSGDQSISYRDK